VLAEGLADNDQPRDHQGAAEVAGEEAGLWLEEAVVSLDVAVRDGVVEEVADELADAGRDQRGEVQKADGFVVVAVAAGHFGRLQQDPRCDVDADGPHEGHAAASG